MSPGSPAPFRPQVFLPSLPRRPGNSCQLLSTKCLQPHPPERPFQTTSPVRPRLFLIRPGAQLNKVGLGTLLTQIFRQDWHSPRDCLEEREVGSDPEPGG